MQERYGRELHTRQVIERLSASLNAADDYLLDMRGIEQISRSAADELYNLTHGAKRVDTINLEPFVEKMLSAVTLGRCLQVVLCCFMAQGLAATTVQTATGTY